MTGRGVLRRHSDDEVIRALDECGSVKKAAALLGYTKASIYSRGKVSALVYEALLRHRLKEHFIDMTGKVVGAWTVLERADNSPDGAAQWKCQHTCGGERLIEGTHLRRQPPNFCSNCRGVK